MDVCSHQFLESASHSRPTLSACLPENSRADGERTMPKAVKGALLQCDPPQMAMVRKIDRESNNAYIIEEIDDHTCLVKETKVEEIKAKVKELMDTAMGVDDEDNDDKDSDLD